jgi:hypothetical protein
MAHIDHYRRKPAWDQGIVDCGSTEPKAFNRKHEGLRVPLPIADL